MQNDYVVLNNALPSNDFNAIIKQFFDGEVNWFFMPSTTTHKNDSDKPYFTHSLYNNNRINSEFYPLFVPVLDVLKIRSLVEMRVNLCMRQSEPIRSEYHVDKNWNDSKTAILYLNTCNGKTILNVNDNLVEVDCVANRMISFRTNIWHAGQFQTDTTRRMVVNLTYF